MVAGRLRVGALVVAVVAIAAVIPPASASFPGANGALAFSSQLLPPPRGSRLQIFSTATEAALANGTEPAWSADGSRIAFSRGDIFMMDADGAHHRRLTNDCNYYFHQPAWSPDGTKIAYLKTADALETIEVLDLGTRATIASSRWAGAITPDWSPDGSKLAYSKNGELFTSDPAGVVETEVTVRSGDSFDSSPSWSPDGSHIAFSSDRSGSWQIWTVAADGTQLKQLTFGSDQQPGGPPIADAPQRYQPVWSPDGSKIAFIQTGLPEQSDLYEIGADGGAQTFVRGTAMSVDWQPINNSAAQPTDATGLRAPHCVTWYRFTARLGKRHHHLYGHVWSQSSLCRRHLRVAVSIQRQRRNGSWHEIANTTADGSGDFRLTVSGSWTTFRFVTSRYEQFAIGSRRGEGCRRAVSNVVHVQAR